MTDNPTKSRIREILASSLAYKPFDPLLGLTKYEWGKMNELRIKAKGSPINSTAEALYKKMVEALLGGKATWEAWQEKVQFEYPFIDSYDFEYLDFVHEIKLDGIAFDKSVSFLETTFAEEVNFENATFAKGGVFWHAKFNKGANFTEAKFKEDIHFNQASFGEGTSFRWTIFDKKAFFFQAKFTEWVDFVRATFTEEADFNEVEFSKGATFEKATFTKKANFNKTKFNEETNFVETVFAEDANFVETIFKKEVNFNQTEFKNFSRFLRAEFMHDAYFKNTTFAKQADFVEAKFAKHGTFTDAEFVARANFWHATFTENALFDKVKFAKHSHFNYATFIKQAIFNGATFIEKVDFSYSEFKKSGFFNRAIFYGNEINFSYMALSADSNLAFENAKFENGVPDFRYLNRNPDMRFHNFSVPSPDKWTAEDIWKSDNEDCYRKLKELAIGNHNHEYELIFYGYEMDSKLINFYKIIKEIICNKKWWRFCNKKWRWYCKKKTLGNTKWWMDILPTRFYKFFSSYGQSIGRPMAVLIFLWFFPFMYDCIADDLLWFDFALSKSNFLFETTKAVTPFPIFMYDIDSFGHLGIKIVASVFWFLLFLGVRNKFKIK